MTTLHENIERIEAEIARACQRAGRSRNDVELMAVSKTCPASALAEAAQLGLSLFGENRVQEWSAKAVELERQLKGKQIRTHLIGHLQSNKALRAVEIFDGVDTVDSLRLAERLNEAALRVGKKLPILLELKLSPEASKAGLDPMAPTTAELLDRLPEMENLLPQGLMTIPPLAVSEAETRACFCSLRTWRDRWAAAHPRLGWNVLSMGMSGDFSQAIEEGATRIRIGTALFGARTYPSPEAGCEP